MTEAGIDSTKGSPSAGKRKHEPVDDGDSDRNGSTPDAPAKRARTIGPAMPPPDMIPQAGDGSDDSSDDDDYGPSLPPPQGASTEVPIDATHPTVDDTTETKPTVDANKRDDWMLRPPDEVDLSSRIDPTKLRNRKFNTQPSRPSPSSGPNTMWTETPDEKRKRLENEVMGVQAPAAAEKPKPQPSEGSAALSKHVQDYNDKNRTKSLYKQHQKNSDEFEKDDDPSARAFDKEKDIRAPSKINNAQRREMLNKSSNFGSRFAGGNFL